MPITTITTTTTTTITTITTTAATTTTTITPQKKRLQFLVIGAGSRGQAYAEAITTIPSAVIHAVAEPLTFKRNEFGKRYIWGPNGEPGEGQAFADWRDWLTWEQGRRRRRSESPPGVDGVFICSLDETHVQIVRSVAPLNLHILCEKPLATSLADCLSIYHTLIPATHIPTKIFSIGHVLRYSPHNLLLRKLLLVDRVIGDIVSIEHCEPVGWWHFAHSYVRGNWRRQTPSGDGSLLTKSCHDIDFILWLLSSPSPDAPHNTPPHAPRSISSIGTLTQFRPDRKPTAAGFATNCLSCPAERDCNYSARKIYGEMHLAQYHTEWPVNIVCPDIEDTLKKSGMAAAEDLLFRHLREDYNRATTADTDIAARPWYGRCVYEADNDVCDDQVVMIAWDNEPSTGRTAKTASLHMIAPTERICERRGRVYGTHGELDYDSRTIHTYSFRDHSSSTVKVSQSAQEARSHGGGDRGLTHAFINAVDAVENQDWDVSNAQMHYLGCSLEDAVRSHAVVFAAEEARRNEKIIRWEEWWNDRLKEFDT